MNAVVFDDLGRGCLAWFGGMLAWDYYELVLGFVTPFPSVADLGFLSFALFFAVGVLFYRPKAPNVPFALMEFSLFGILISCMLAAHLRLHSRGHRLPRRRRDALLLQSARPQL